MNGLKKKHLDKYKLDLHSGNTVVSCLSSKIMIYWKLIEIIFYLMRNIMDNFFTCQKDSDIL